MWKKRRGAVRPVRWTGLGRPCPDGTDDHVQVDTMNNLQFRIMGVFKFVGLNRTLSYY
jgi:hypothetical protein